MVASTHMMHRGATDVERNRLADYLAPPPTDTWFPIAHSTMLDSVESHLQGAGFDIVKSRLSLSNEGHRFFGTLDLATKVADGIALAVGIRNSTDKSFPIGFCCGTRVFVCDNLAFTSEIVISKKHTRFGQERYLEGLSKAIASLGQYQEASRLWVNRLQQWELPEDVANSLMLQAYEQELVSSRLLPLIIREWRNPPIEDYKPRTGWSLFNSFTAVLGRTKQATHPAQAALTTIRLQRLLAPPDDVIDASFAPVEQ